LRSRFSTREAELEIVASWLLGFACKSDYENVLELHQNNIKMSLHLIRNPSGHPLDKKMDGRLRLVSRLRQKQQ